MRPKKRKRGKEIVLVFLVVLSSFSSWKHSKTMKEKLAMGANDEHRESIARRRTRRGCWRARIDYFRAEDIFKPRLEHERPISKEKEARFPPPCLTSNKPRGGHAVDDRHGRSRKKTHRMCAVFFASLYLLFRLCSPGNIARTQLIKPGH